MRAYRIPVLVMLTMCTPVAAQQGYVPNYVDHARCVAVAKVVATKAKDPAQARHFATEAQRAEKAARAKAIAEGKSAADADRMIASQTSQLARGNPDFPDLLESNLGLCVSSGLLKLP